MTESHNVRMLMLGSRHDASKSTAALDDLSAVVL